MNGNTLSGEIIQENDIKETEMKPKKNRKKITASDIYEIIAKIIFMMCASVAVLGVVVITVYIFAMGFPAILEIGIVENGHIRRHSCD